MPAKKWYKDTIQEELAKENYKLLEVYWVNKTYQKQLWVKIQCPNNHIEDKWFNGYIKGRRCKQCAYKELDKIIWDQDLAIKFYQEKGYKLIEEYINVDAPHYCIDDLGFYKKLSISNLKTGDLDLKNKFRVGNKYIWNNVKNFCKINHIDYIPVKQEYKGIKEKYYFKYIGNNLPITSSRYFKTSMDCFVNGKVKHPDLTSSKGELRIKRFLDSNKIKYKRQYTFNNLKNIKKLRFDFGILDKNNNLKFLCEYDSNIHIQEVKIWDGEVGFKNRQLKDSIKNKFCKDNNINLLRIQQKDWKDIEKILEKELIKKPKN